MQPDPSEFILYAALFRLVSIVAGTFIIYMGYRLFVLREVPENAGELHAKAKDIELTLKNAAPGTFFTLFGTIIITVMIWKGVPSLQVSGRDTTRLNEDRETALLSSEKDFTLRNEDSEGSKSLERGKILVDSGKYNQAIKVFSDPLREPSLPLGKAAGFIAGIADVYHRIQSYKEGWAYIKLALQVNPDDAHALAVLARIEKELGNMPEAVRAIRQAAKLDSSFIAERNEMLGQNQ